MRSHFLAAILLTALPVLADTPPAFSQGLVIAQSVEQTHPVDPASVAQLPAVEQRVSFVTGHGTEQATYPGALLWSLLEQAGGLGTDPRTRHVAALL